MTLTQSLYNIISSNPLITIPIKSAGVVPSSVDSRNGLLTWFPLPSAGIGFGTSTGVTQYQLDVWHENMYSAEGYKEELIDALCGTAGIQDGRALIISMDSDLGGVYDDAGNIWHYTLIINIKYNRKVS